METAAETARTASRTRRRGPEEEQGLDAETAQCSRAGAQGTDTLLDLFRGLLRVSQAKSCAAKAPDKLTDTPRSNIATWLEVAETYLRAKQVPLAEWPATILTFLTEGPLVKAKRALLQETAGTY